MKTTALVLFLLGASVPTSQKGLLDTIPMATTEAKEDSLINKTLKLQALTDTAKFIVDKNKP